MIRFIVPRLLLALAYLIITDFDTVKAIFKLKVINLWGGNSYTVWGYLLTQNVEALIELE